MAFTEYFLSRREQISWKEEATFGSAVTPDEIVGKNVIITPSMTKGWQETLASGADSREVAALNKGPEDLRFDLEFIPVDWTWVKYVFGTVVDNDEGAYYSHTFALTNTVQSFTLEWAKRGATNHVITLAGCSVIRATVRFAKATGPGEEGHIKVTLSCVGKAQTPGTTVTTIAAPTAEGFQYRMAKLTIAGSEVVEVNSGEITYDTGIDPNDSRYCNSTLDVAIGETIPKTFRITGRMNINLKDDTYYDLWNAATVVGSTNKIEFIRGTNDQMLFNFGSMYVNEAVAPTNLEGVTITDVVFTALSGTTTIAEDDNAVY